MVNDVLKSFLAQRFREAVTTCELQIDRSKRRPAAEGCRKFMYEVEVVALFWTASMHALLA
jgi:hypothetical protein